MGGRQPRTAPKLKARVRGNSGPRGDQVRGAALPEHIPTPDLRAKVAVMAATFMSHDLIASDLGIGAKTLRKHYRLELDTAQERSNATVVARLHSLTTKSPVACFFWLQNRDRENWKHAAMIAQEQARGNTGGLSLSQLVTQSLQEPIAAPSNANANGHAKPNGHAKNGTNGNGHG